MRITADPYGAAEELPPETRVRFHFGAHKYIDVYERDGVLVVHGDGFTGGLMILPKVTNEIEIKVDRDGR